MEHYDIAHESKGTKDEQYPSLLLHLQACKGIRWWLKPVHIIIDARLHA